jgi:hypothetical protein
VRDRILLGHLAHNGDCLYATILARQLRKDHPDAHITWAISRQCAGLLINNPHIDEVLEIPLDDLTHDRVAAAWAIFEREVLRDYIRREFDHVLLSQMFPNNFHNYDGTVRPSILRAYGQPITVPIENIIALTPHEIDRVEQFALIHGLAKFRHRILFECSSSSEQSFVTPSLAQTITSHIYRLLPDATVIFSTGLRMTLRDARSRYAGTLSLREIAHLSRHCSLFVGCGSGCSVAVSSTAAQPLPMVQLLRARTSVFASLAHDFEYYGIKDRAILEMTEEDPKRIAQCICIACQEGTEVASARFGSRVPLHFNHYFGVIQTYLLKKYRCLDAARSLLITAGRYGWSRDLVNFGEKHIAPKLPIDPAWLFAKHRRAGDEFRARLADAARLVQSPTGARGCLSAKTRDD